MWTGGTDGCRSSSTKSQGSKTWPGSRCDGADGGAWRLSGRGRGLSMDGVDCHEITVRYSTVERIRSGSQRQTNARRGCSCSCMAPMFRPSAASTARNRPEPWWCPLLQVYLPRYRAPVPKSRCQTLQRCHRCHSRGGPGTFSPPSIPSIPSIPFILLLVPASRPDSRLLRAYVRGGPAKH